MGFELILITKKAHPMATDLFDEIIETDLSDQEQVGRLVDDLKNRFVLQGIICNYEPYVLQKAFIAQKLGLQSLSPYAAACTRNKALQRKAFSSLEENVPFELVDTFSQAQTAFSRLGKNAYLKSISGVKSRFVFHVTSDEELKDAWELFQMADHDLDLYDDFFTYGFDFSYPDPKKYLLVEKACSGFQIALSSFVGSEQITHTPSATDVYPASYLGFEDSFLAFRILPSKLSDEQLQRAYGVVGKIVSALDLKYCGLHTELLLQEDGTYKIIEVASRLGGYRPFMYREVYGLSLPKMLLHAVLGENFSPEGEVSGKYISMMEIFPRQSGIFQSLSGLDSLKVDPSVSRILEKKSPGEPVGLAKEGFPPVLTFLISGSSYEVVYQKSLYYQQYLKAVIK
jgi:hypothetical protein